MRAHLRPLLASFTLILSLLAAPPEVRAASDFYSTAPGVGAPDGMCDVWQGLFNAWGLADDGDDDFDGSTNLVESIAGTDPRNPADSIKVGNTTIAGNTITFTFAAEAGKRYRILSDASSPTGAFATVETHLAPVNGATELVPTADNAAQTITITRAGTSKFYQVETTDADSDGDGVSDWAEGKLGSNPIVAENSGAGYNYADTLHSMLSLVAAPTVPTGYEKDDKTATTPVAVPAKIGLTRTWPPVGSPVPVMALNGITLTGAGGAPSATKANASAGDVVLGTVNIPAGAGAAGGAPHEVNVTPVQDAAEEVPEYLEVTFNLPGGSGVEGPSAVVTISDADPANAKNQQLYVAYLGREAGVTSTASGYATALVNGDHTSASISLVFNNLSSEQNTAYIRSGPENDLAPALPLGQISGVNYNIAYKPGFLSTDQAFLTALTTGNIGCAVTSANYPGKEIFGYFQKATGSTTFDPNHPSLDAPALGSANWQTATNEQIERDIWRFMSQSTFGGTTALYNEIRAKVDAAIGGGGTYLDGLEDWLDEQMNPAQTPTINFMKLVMAADNEEFMLRGNKPITFSSDPQFNGAAYNVTYDANGVPTISPTADNNRAVNNYPQSGPNRRREWWTMVLQSQDQVRQRMTQALSEILVISEADQTVLDRHYGCANYWDMMAAGAFGKYRTLLEQVTYSPMMGFYLSHIANRATYDAGGGLTVSPDENYAREIMQLFSIGLVLRHPDGSLVLDGAGLPTPTYDQTDITELARVMTGWSHGARNATSWVSQWNTTTLTWNHQSSQRVGSNILFNGSSTNSQWFGSDAGHLFFPTPWIYPMKLMGRIGSTVYHDFFQYDDPDTGLPVANVSKRLLAGKHGQYDILLPNPALPAATGYSNDVLYHNAAALDMTRAHNALAGDPNAAVYPEPEDVSQSAPGHTNTAINISRWLIQRLVTSNPSNGYIYRVQQAYRATNGNLGAVMKAILLDYEARSLQLADSSISHGKVKEPLVAFSSMLRGLRAFSGAPLSILKDNAPPFSASDSPLPGPYPADEYAKFSTHNLNPPSLPAGWAQGPFRMRYNDLTGSIGQSPQRAPSVFNWFMPDYVKPGAMAEAGLYAPELQISTESSDVAKVNFFYNYALSNPVGASTQPGSDSAISDFVLSNNSATGAALFTVNGQVTNSLTFNSSNWNTDQTITVTAVNNSGLGLTSNGLLRFNITGTGTGYDGIVQAPESLTILDNELPNEAILVSNTSFSTWVQEGGNTDTVNVRLSAPPPSGANVTITPTTTGQVTFSPASLVFSSITWNANQTLTLTAVNDAVTEAAGTANDTLVLTSSSTAANFNGLTASLPVNVIDSDDGASSYGVVITESGGGTAVDEASGSDTYTVRLAKAPSTGTVTVRATAGTGLYMNTSGTSLTQDITFTSADWSTNKTFTVRANNDGTAEASYPANPGHIGRITHAITSNVGGYTTGLPIQTLGVPIADNDERIIMAHVGGNETRVSEDGVVTDTFTVRLRTLPTANVTVSFGSNTVTCDPPFLTFTPANYTTNQTVTVRASDDSEKQGLRSAWTEGVIPINATATASFASGGVTGFTMTNVGAGYTSQPRVTLSGGGGSGANAYALLSAQGTITEIQVVSAGTGYTSAPTVTIDPPPYGGGVIIATATSDNSADGNYNGYWSYTHSSLKVSILDNDLTRLLITETSGGTEVGESGATDTYTLALTSAPMSDVTVNINPILNTSVPPVGQVTTDVTSVTFTPSNWNSPQTVTVTGVNDTTVEGDINTLIYHTVQSTDKGYSGLQSTPLTVMVVDNDNLPLTITHLDGYTAVAEGGPALVTSVTNGWIHLGDRFNVRLPVAPNANVTVTLISDSSQISVSPSTLSFTAANGTTDQSVTVTAVNDGINEASPHQTAIRFQVASTDVRYNNPPVETLMIPIHDNGTPGFIIGETDSGTSITLPYGGSTRPTEGGTDTFLVVLNRAPTSNVVLSVTSASTADLTVSPATLTFTPANWNTRQTVTVTAVNDQVIEGREKTDVTLAVVDASSDDTFDPAPDQVVPVWVYNNQRRNEGLIIVTTGNSNYVAEGGKSDNVLFYLSNRPDVPVQVSIDANAQFGFDKTSFVFTPDNWNVPQSVTVTAVDDLAVEYNHSSNIQFRCNATPGGTLLLPGDARWTFSNPTSSMNLVDNDSAGLVIEETSGDTRTTEGGGGGSNVDSYTVRLSKAPNGNVVVTPISASTSLGQTVSPVSLTFTTANWDQPQTVTVTVTNDTTVETYSTSILNQANIHTYNITHAITSASTDNGRHEIPLSNGVTVSGSRIVSCASTAGVLAGMSISGTGIPANATVSSVDNATVLTISANATANGSGLSLTAFASGYVVSLTSAATTNASRTVTCASTANLRAGMSITGTGMPGGATVSSVDSATSLTISANATATNSGLTLTAFVVSQPVTNFITDDDIRVITRHTGLDTRVHEDGSFSDTYEVVLRSAPTANVTVAVTVPGGQGLQASPTSLLFTTGDWNTPKIVTVSGVDNGVNDRARTVDITHTSSSADAAFNAQTVPAIRVQAIALDTPQIVLYEGGSFSVLTEGGQIDDYYIGLSHPPTSNVTVQVSPDAQQEVGLVAAAGTLQTYSSALNLTFTPTDWTIKRVLMRAIDDLTPEATPHVGWVTHSATCSDARYNSIAIAGVPTFITDNDYPAVRVIPSGGSTLISEAGVADTYRVHLTRQPASDVTISINAGAQASVVSPGPTLTFTNSNWNLPQTVTVTAVNDAAVEGTHTDTITHSATSGDSLYNGIGVPAVTASITDNDGPQLVVTHTGGNTTVTEGNSTDTFTIRLSQIPTGGNNVNITLVPPVYIIPTPPYAKQFGYYTSDLGGSNQQRERVVMDFAEIIHLYRDTFYDSLETVYGTGNIPASPADADLQNAHWTASKALIDKLDLWWCGGSLKARYPVLIEPNQALPDPLPAANPRQVLLDCIYILSGGNNNLSTTRYEPEIVFNPKLPPNTTFANEVRDRARWAAYLMSTVMPAFVAH